MDVPYKSFLSSDVFKIEGPNGSTFFAHSNLIAKHSRILNCDVNGGLKETEDKMIRIKDIDGDIDDGTVMRFIEFAYTGEYTTPDKLELFKVVDQPSDDTKMQANPSKCNDTESVIVDAPITKKPSPSNMEAWIIAKPKFLIQETNAYTGNQEHNTPACKHCRSNDLIVRGKRRNMMYCRDCGQTQDIDAKNTRIDLFRSKASTKPHQTWIPRTSSGSDSSDYTPDLLTHAQLYVFSTRYECANLASLTLQKLRLTLSRYVPVQDFKPIARLLKYTYLHTPDYASGIDRLRQLVVEYTVCYLDKIMSHGFFEKLLTQEGRFAADLFVCYMQAP